jgi:hypothetical protein
MMVYFGISWELMDLLRRSVHCGSSTALASIVAEPLNDFQVPPGCYAFHCLRCAPAIVDSVKQLNEIEVTTRYRAVHSGHNTDAANAMLEKELDDLSMPGLRRCAQCVSHSLAYPSAVVVILAIHRTVSRWLRCAACFIASDVHAYPRLFLHQAKGIKASAFRCCVHIVVSILFVSAHRGLDPLNYIGMPRLCRAPHHST